MIVSVDLVIVNPVPTFNVLTTVVPAVDTPDTFSCFDINVPSLCAVTIPARVVLKELSPHTQRPVQQPITNSLSAVTEDA